MILLGGEAAGRPAAIIGGGDNWRACVVFAWPSPFSKVFERLDSFMKYRFLAMSCAENIKFDAAHRLPNVGTSRSTTSIVNTPDAAIKAMSRYES
jgi:hypothetical protein